MGNIQGGLGPKPEPATQISHSHLTLRKQIRFFNAWNCNFSLLLRSWAWLPESWYPSCFLLKPPDKPGQKHTLAWSHLLSPAMNKALSWALRKNMKLLLSERSQDGKQTPWATLMHTELGAVLWSRARVARGSGERNPVKQVHSRKWCKLLNVVWKGKVLSPASACDPDCVQLHPITFSPFPRT